MSRQDQYRVEVSVDGRDLGVFDSFAGGEGDSEEVRHRPGGMGAEKSLGGPTTIGNFTVGRLYELERDHPLVPWLMSRRGKGDVVAKKQPLDVDRNPVGQPLTYTGKLKAVTPPDHDSNSNDPAVIELEVVPHGDIT